MSARSLFVWCLRFGVGVLAGIVLHYTLYRMNMPMKPFIYQAF
ncbi:MAG TPA: hypothetical protein VG097_01465 [Gemmata sp.]|nr:hypothetical protein [Gemmata sp.]